MRIGIFGGTFDPPHNGHLLLAQAALHDLELDELVWIPAAKNPLKVHKSLAGGRDRLEMVKMITANNPKFSVSDIDLSRGGKTFTVDTLFELQAAKEGEYWFLMGADALRDIMEWKQPQKLVKMCRIGAVVRPPYNLSEILQYLPEEIREVVDEVTMPPSIIASHEIREAISRRRPADQWVPQSVLRYITDKKLYL